MASSPLAAASAQRRRSLPPPPLLLRPSLTRSLTAAFAAAPSGGSSAPSSSGSGGGGSNAPLEAPSSSSSSSSSSQPLRRAGPASPPPDYAAIDSAPLNRAVMALFRRKMVAALDGADSPADGYGAIIDLTRRLNRRYPTARETQLATRGILNSLFPSWLPGAFKVMFSRPFRDFSCRLNALATALTCQWLMGPCKVNDVEVDGGAVGAGMGVLVERCRYLEEAGCASICINSCKAPTQEFFARDMGLPLTMTPNYEDFSCQFSFGRTPAPQAEDEAFATQCFSQCPSRKRAFSDANARPGDCTNIAILAAGADDAL